MIKSIQYKMNNLKDALHETILFEKNSEFR